MIIDTHAHYDDKQFNTDREELLASFKAAGIGAVVNIGSDMESCRWIVDAVEKYPMMYGAIGVHPSDSKDMTDEDLKWIEVHSEDEKILAIGEIGLDYYWDEPDRFTQKKWFEAQMDLAQKVKLPIVIHSRDAAKETYDMMQAAGAKNIGGVVHCYSYSKEMARSFLDLGFYLGIGGVVTFKNGRNLKETVEYAPLNRLVLETDSPYLSPEPNRGKRNSSLNLPYVVKTIANIKGISMQEVIDITEKNARMMYRMEEV